MTTVADVMTKSVLTVSLETPVREIATLLYTKNISGVPVINETGEVVGVVSEGDLMGHAAAVGESPRRRSWLATLLSGGDQLAQDYSKSHGHTAGDVMTRDVQTTTEETALADVVKIMERRRVKRLPVLRDGKLVGIVTRRDMLRLLATNAAVVPMSVDDRKIREDLLAELDGQSWANVTNKNIIVDSGVVHLFGLVDSDAERQAIVAAARDIEGVVDVQDHLAPALHLPI